MFGYLLSKGYSIGLLIGPYTYQLGTMNLYVMSDKTVYKDIKYSINVTYMLFFETLVRNEIKKNIRICKSTSKQTSFNENKINKHINMLIIITLHNICGDSDILIDGTSRIFQCVFFQAIYKSLAFGRVTCT